MLTTTDRLPEALYTAEEVRALDAAIINRHGVPGIQLMARASRALFSALESHWADCRELHIFCGKGNNAGDGYLLAALAKERGYTVSVWVVGAHPERGDALLALQRAEAAGLVPAVWQGERPTSGVVVDAILGTGLQGDVRPRFADAIHAINSANLPVLAVDIPSGLCADTGCALGDAVRADLTVSFIGLKRGLFTADAKAHCGDILFSDLQAPAAVYSELPARVHRLQLSRELENLPPRQRIAHKGHFGHVLVIGGEHGMGGAAMLAVSAAARSGAGLLSCATRPEHIAGLLASRPEVMVRAVETPEHLAPLLEKATVLSVGPGLGQGEWGRQLLARALPAAIPKVIDADALNLLAKNACGIGEGALILTPHPGEAARLLQVSTAEIHRDRFAAAAALRERYGATVVLKGAGTVIADELGLAVCCDGNPGMASGGMGDVLSGILAALLAQGLSAAQAARLGVCAHAVAADRAAARGERGMLASDVVDELRAVLN